VNLVIASRFEHAIPTPFGLREEVERLCAEARAEQYRAVIVPSSRVAEAREGVEGSDVMTSCLIGFPLGWSDPDAKRFEIEVAVDAGAHEIEYVPSLARLKEKQYDAVLREMRDAADACEERPLKIVIEASLWTAEELSEITRVVLDSGAKFIATGFTAKLEVIARIRELVGPDFGIKCELPSLEIAAAAIEAGADLLSLGRLARPGAKSQAFGI
jgi:deoxyribose-phosphate aldolase